MDTFSHYNETIFRMAEIVIFCITFTITKKLSSK